MSELVSCLCVTHGRAARLEGAVNDFLGQTYRSRELVVVHGADDVDTTLYMDRLAARCEVASMSTHAGVQTRALQLREARIVSVRVIEGPRRSLGALRNLSVEHARGRYVCQWDDDDIHAPTRVDVQASALDGTASKVCTLQQLTFYDRSRGAAFRSFARDEGWDGTLFCERAAMPRYPELERAEDTAVLYALVASHRVTAIRRPELYVYVIHGLNTWHRAHFDSLLAASRRLPDDDAAPYARIVNERYG